MPEFESTYEYKRGYPGFFGFKVGTCHGLWRVKDKAYEIVVAVNEQQGNGHFKATMLWFEESARRDNMIVKICEVWNPRLRKMLKKHGYKRRGWTLFTFSKTP